MYSESKEHAILSQLFLMFFLHKELHLNSVTYVEQILFVGIAFYDRLQGIRIFPLDHWNNNCQ